MQYRQPERAIVTTGFAVDGARQRQPDQWAYVCISESSSVSGVSNVNVSRLW